MGFKVVRDNKNDEKQFDLDKKLQINKYIDSVMSQLRDIHKLRHNYNVQTSSNRFMQSDRFNHQFEHFPESSRNQRHHQVQNFGEISTQYGSKQIINKTNDKRNHQRGYSNGVIFNEKKDSEIMPSSLSMYSKTMKLGPRTSYPMTSRHEKIADIPSKQTMPQTESSKIGKKIRQEISQKICKSNFQILCPIGKGGFGKVWKVENKKTGQIMAMKEMYKAKIIQKKSINSVMNQRKLLAKLKHPFIINMVCAFQTRENLFLLMDYIDGGDLRYHIGKKRRFSENQTRFFMANIIIGLEYLHYNKIIHRDMKPQNIVFDSDGYLRITDMGISRELREDNHQDTSGTPGYMSPEVICRKNHTYTADYFALGVMGYQFMLGKRPYVGKNRKQIRDQILSKQATVKPEERPHKWSVQGADFINKLLTRNPSNRLGANGINQIKSHPWLSIIDWNKLKRKQIVAPYIPRSIEENYQQYKEQISEDTVDENYQENQLMLRDKEVQSLFQDYYLNRVQTQRKRIPSYTTTYSESQYRK